MATETETVEPSPTASIVVWAVVAAYLMIGGMTGRHYHKECDLQYPAPNSCPPLSAVFGLGWPLFGTYHLGVHILDEMEGS